MFRYYSRLQPITPCGIPREGMVRYENFDQREYVEDMGCRVWGWVDYDRPLTAEEMAEHFLFPAREP